MELYAQVMWLAICIYHEARGEPWEGQIAVGHVVMNRVASENKSIKDVVLRPYQFSWANNNKRPPIANYQAFITSYNAAIECLYQRVNGKDLYGADHYFAVYIDPPTWVAGMKFVKRIGRHLFYRS